MKISAFPKCYLEEISNEGGMTVFDWIEMAKPLGADGLEMYEGFFTSLDDRYILAARAMPSPTPVSRCPCSAVRPTSPTPTRTSALKPWTKKRK